MLTLAPPAVADLCFAVEYRGESQLLRAHELYAALCRLAPPVKGIGLGILLDGDRLIIRGRDADLRWLCALAGRAIMVGDRPMWLRAAGIEPLRESLHLACRVATIKPGDRETLTPGRLQQEAQRQASAVAPSASVEVVGGRQCVCIVERRVPAYPLRVTLGDPAEAIALQAAGIGGRRAFGCGVLLPC